MKKHISIILALVLILSLTACKKDTADTPAPDVNVKKDTVTVYLPVAKTTYGDDGEVMSKVTYTYDERGLMLSQSYDHKESITEYDEVEDVYYTEFLPCDGVPDQVYSYTYDEKGNLTSYRYDHTVDGYILYEYTYSYGEDGKILSFRRQCTDTVWNSQNSDMTYTVEYDDAGNAVKLTSVNEEGETVVNGEYSYDAQGNLITTVFRKDQPGDYTYNFTYNEKGQLASFADGSVNHLFDYRYTYDADGLLIREDSTVSADKGSINYTYQNGVLTGAQRADTKFLFDKHGNAIQIEGEEPQYTYQAMELRPEDAQLARATWIAQNPNPYMSSIHVSMFSGYSDVFFRAVPHPRWSIGPMLPAYIY